VLAVGPRVQPELRQVLKEEFALMACVTLDAARSTLVPQKTDLVLCEIYFDESRMCDLLRYAKAHPVARLIPFVCLNEAPQPLIRIFRMQLDHFCTLV
jgi:response regulator of citrate/malate metabolism